MESRPMGVKLVSRYDPAAETEVRDWIRELLNTDLPPGPENMHRNLRSGVVLVNLVKTVYQGSADLPPAAQSYLPFIKPNNSPVSFRQMENIEIFLRACEAYGVPETSIFPTNNLFENKNMGNVIDCIIQLGTQAQKNNFNGPTCGPKPTTAQRRNFSYEQLKAGQGIIGLQAGSNKFASQKGMSIGAVRHVSDIKADGMTQEGQGIINLQSGTNKFASQKGMSMGAVRHISDIRADDILPESHGMVNLQAGTNKFASQKGMSMGAVRHISDIRADDMAQESQGVINLQAGTNRGASQRGMSMGGVRHISDIRVAPILRDSHGIINLQSGTNSCASQAGMSMGAGRHITDVASGRPSSESEAFIRLQAGTNQYANQNGVNFGKPRGINDLRVKGSPVSDNSDYFRRYYDYDYRPVLGATQVYREDDGDWL